VKSGSTADTASGGPLDGVTVTILNPDKRIGTHMQRRGPCAGPRSQRRQFYHPTGCRMTVSAQASKARISKDGRTAIVSISVSVLQRGGRKQILSPPGTTPWSPAPRVDSALVEAVVRAHRWRQMIESGKYASSAELAKAEKVNDSYLSRILRLTLIAPDIIEAILAGCQPSTLQLNELLKPLPAAWDQQRSNLHVSQ
jgi:hypothetical protein